MMYRTPHWDDFSNQKFEIKRFGLSRLSQVQNINRLAPSGFST